MWRLLKQALFARVDTPLLGDVPVNVVGLACFAVLGIANPGFWFLGAALESGYLVALLSNPRFRNFARAQDLAADARIEEVETGAQVKRLDEPRRRRYALLDQKCARVAQLYSDRQIERFLVDGNLAALDKLRDYYLDLLIADQDLQAAESAQIETQIQRQIAALERELAANQGPGSLRDSKAATLAILRKRLTSLSRRQQTLEEIDSDLLRIEAQTDLAVENALIEGKPQVISTSIELVSHLLDGTPDFLVDSDPAPAATQPPTRDSGETAAPKTPPRAVERNE